MPARVQLAVIAPGTDDQPRFFGAPDNRCVVLGSDRAGMPIQHLRVSRTPREDVRDNQSAVPPLPRAALAPLDGWIVLDFIRCARVQHREHARWRRAGPHPAKRVSILSARAERSCAFRVTEQLAALHSKFPFRRSITASRSRISHSGLRPASGTGRGSTPDVFRSSTISSEMLRYFATRGELVVHLNGKPGVADLDRFFPVGVVQVLALAAGYNPDAGLERLQIHL